MTAQTAMRFWKECSSKVPYSKFWHAEAARLRLERFTGHHFVTYKCSFCGRRHIGHPPRREMWS